MKLLHIADLHIGKRVNEFNMRDDQAHVLSQILSIAESEEPAGIIIAGDVYDKSQPSSDAVALLDDFLTKLISLNLHAFIISGNHDSPERLSFCNRIMQKNGLHIAGAYEGSVQVESLYDDNGMVNIYLLPYLKPAVVKPYFSQDIETYDDAVKTVISSINLDQEQRNILLAHQFVTNGIQQPMVSDSESISVGGSDNIDASGFDAFDYVALGHLHGPQSIGKSTIRYAGSPLKYSFSEVRQSKSVTIIELKKKGDINLRFVPLMPLHDMREIKGPIAELLESGRENPDIVNDYIHATLTDEDEIYDALGQLRAVYPNLMALDYDNSRYKHINSSASTAADEFTQKSPIQLFSEFYESQNNNPLSEAQLQVLSQIFELAGGVEL